MKKDLAAAESYISYTICIDPKQPVITKGAGVASVDGKDNNQPLVNDLLTLQKFTSSDPRLNNRRTLDVAVPDNPYPDSSIRHYMWLYESNGGVANHLYCHIKAAMSGRYLFPEGTGSNKVAYAANAPKWEGQFGINWGDNATIPDEHIWLIVYIPSEDKYTIQNTQRTDVYICNNSGSNGTQSAPYSNPRLDITKLGSNALWTFLQYDSGNSGFVYVFSSSASEASGFGYTDTTFFNSGSYSDPQQTYFTLDMMGLPP